jgi:glycosyltransferase involved in cell wall biosynthesis
MARIVHVSGSLNEGGGPAGYLFRLQKAIAEMPSEQHEVDFLLLPKRKQTYSFRLRRFIFRQWHRNALRFRIESAHHYSINGRRFKAKAFAPWDQRIWDYDYVFLHDPLFAMDIVRYRRPGCRVVVMTHSPTPIFAELGADEDPSFLLEDCLRDRFLLRFAGLERHTYEQADYIVAPCGEAHEAYRACGERWASLFHCNRIISCLTGTPEPPSNRCPQEWRTELGVGADQLLGVYVGRNHPHKGTDLIISAIERLRPDLRKRLVFAFAGFKNQGPSLPGVRYVGYTSDVGGLVSASDFVINANRYTYFDLFALEVLSKSKPLLATNTGGNVYLSRLSHGVSLVNATVEGVVAGIEDFAELSSVERTQLGRANREAWEKWFSATCFRHHHVALYNRLTSINV